MDRAQLVVDAAVRVLAERGARSLTHRAVDAEAGLPSGSTSNVFRSRRTLVTAVVAALLEHDRGRLGAAGSAGPSVGAALARFVQESARDDGALVRARLALLSDSDASALRDGRSALVGLAEVSLEDLTGRPVSRAAASTVVAILDGVLTDAVLFGRPISLTHVAAAVDAVLDAPIG